MMDGGPVSLVVYNISTGVLSLGLLFGLLFGVIYGLSAPWWRSAIGRMFIAITFAVVIGVGTLVFLIVSGPGPSDLSWQRLLPRSIGYGAFTIAMAWLLGTFLHERHVNRPGSVPVAPELFWVIRRLFRRPEDRG